MAVTNNSRTPGNQTLGAAATSTSVSMTATVAAGLSNGILIAVVQTDAGASASSVQWDTAGVNEALTQFGIVSQGSARAEIWYRKNPTSGTSKTLQANWSGTHHGAISCAVYEGVDQTTPWNAAGPQTATGAAGTDPSLGITTAVGEFAIDSVVWDLAGTTDVAPAKGASQNYIGAGIHTVTNAISGAGSDKASASSTETFTWTADNAPASAWGQVAGSLKAAASVTDTGEWQFNQPIRRVWPQGQVMY